MSRTEQRYLEASDVSIDDDIQCHELVALLLRMGEPEEEAETISCEMTCDGPLTARTWLDMLRKLAQSSDPIAKEKLSALLGSEEEGELTLSAHSEETEDILRRLPGKRKAKEPVIVPVESSDVRDTAKFVRREAEKSGGQEEVENNRQNLLGHRQGRRQAISSTKSGAGVDDDEDFDSNGVLLTPLACVRACVCACECFVCVHVCVSVSPLHAYTFVHVRECVLCMFVYVPVYMCDS
jgi:hypothetical protein